MAQDWINTEEPATEQEASPTWDEDSLQPKGTPPTRPEYTLAEAEDRASKTAVMATYVQEDPLKAHARVRDELVSEGRSDLWEDLEVLAAGHKNKAVRQYFSNVIQTRAQEGTLDDEQLAFIVEEFQKKQENIGTEVTSVEDVNNLIFDTLKNTTAEGTVPEEQRVQREGTGSYNYQYDPDLSFEDNARQLADESIVSLLGKGHEGTSENVVALLGDATAIIAPFVDQYYTTRLYGGLQERGWLAEDQSMTELLFNGEAKVKIREVFDTLVKNEDWEELDAFVEDFTDVLRNEVGGDRGEGERHGNELDAMFTALVVLRERPEGFDWDRWLDNFGTVLDAFAVGGIVRILRATNTVKKVAKGSTADVVSKANPPAGRELVARGLMSAQDARALGTTQEELANSHIYPKYRNYQLEAMPSGVARELERLQQQADIAFTQAGRRAFMFTPEEKAGAVGRVREQLKNANNAVLHEEKSFISITPDEQGIEIDAMFGMTKDYGFGSIDEAAAKADELFEGGADGFYWRDPKTNNIVELTQDQVKALRGQQAPGEYFFQAKGRQDFVPEDALFFETDEMFSGTGITGTFKRYLLDPASKFSRNIVRGANRSHDVGAAVSRDLTDLVKQNWDKLSFNGQRKVAGILEEGAAENRWFEYDDLVTRFPDITEKEIKAYYAARTFWDTIWEIQNRDLYQSMKGRGLKHIRAGNWQGVGKAVPPESFRDTFKAVENDLFDPTTGKINTYTYDELVEMERRGMEIFRSPVPEWVGDIGTNFILRSPSAVEVKALPRNVMQYIPGYYPRIYEDAYFVKKAFPARLNGEQGNQVRTVYTATTRGDAVRKADYLNTNKGSSGERYYTELAQELLRGDQSQVADDIQRLNVEGRLFFSPRGARLENVNGSQARIENPIATIQRSARAVGQSASHNTYISAMKERFFNTYKALLPERGVLKNMSSKEVAEYLKTSGKTLSEPGGEQAREVWNYIRLMEGSEEGDAVLWKRSMIKLSDFISQSDSRFAGSLARGVINAKDFAPMRSMRSLAFTMYLALNPVRQLVLQSQQAMYLAGVMPGYFASGRLFRDHYAMLGVFARDGLARKLGKFGDKTESESSVRKAAAAVMGIPKSEVDMLVKKFRESGFAEAIDSHLFVSGALSGDMAYADNVLKHFGQASLNKAKAPLRVAKAGFDVGELKNMLSSYLVAIRRFKQNNPKVGHLWHTDKYFDDIMGDARDMALAMTKSGAMPYQRGAASLAMQFFAIQHKALLGMFTNKVFTPMERLRIMTSQFALYGFAGMGLHELVDRALDHLNYEATDKELEVIWGGLIDWTVNSMVEAATDEDSDLRIGAEFSPAGGVVETPHEMLTRLTLQTDKSLGRMIMEAFAGPSGQALFKVKENTSRAMQIMGITNEGFSTPEITEDNAARALFTMAELASGYNNYIKVRMWRNMQKNNILMNEIVPELTDAEAFARQWFGVRSAEELDPWQDISTLPRGSGGGTKGDLDKAAEEIYERAKATALRYLEVDGRYEFNQEFVDQMLETEQFVWFAFADNPSDALYVRNKIGELMERDRSAGKVGFHTILAGALSDGRISRDRDNLDVVRTQVLNNQALSDQEKERVVQALESMLDDSMIRQLRDTRIPELKENE